MVGAADAQELLKSGFTVRGKRNLLVERASLLFQGIQQVRVPALAKELLVAVSPALNRCIVDWERSAAQKMKQSTGARKPKLFGDPFSREHILIGVRLDQLSKKPTACSFVGQCGCSVSACSQMTYATDATLRFHRPSVFAESFHRPTRSKYFAGSLCCFAKSTSWLYSSSSNPAESSYFAAQVANHTLGSHARTCTIVSAILN